MCGDQGAASCGPTGLCAVAGACAVYPAGAPCALAGCAEDGKSVLPAAPATARAIAASLRADEMPRGTSCVAGLCTGARIFPGKAPAPRERGEGFAPHRGVLE